MSKILNAQLLPAKILAVVFTIFMSFYTQNAFAAGYQVNQDTYVVGVASWDVLNIRKWPASNSRIVGETRQGARVWVERCIIKPGKNDWCKIAWQGQYGWVNSRFLNL